MPRHAFELLVLAVESYIQICNVNSIDAERSKLMMAAQAALFIVDRLQNDLGDDLGRLKSKELEVLLRWKGVPVSTMGNVANRRILYQQFAEGVAEEVSVPAPWTEMLMNSSSSMVP